MSDAYDADREQDALQQAFDSAERITAALNQEWESAGEITRVSLHMSTGAEDQAVFTFTLRLDLEEDFDTAMWPADHVEELSEAIRARVIGSAVDDWDWLVTARAVASID